MYKIYYFEPGLVDHMKEIDVNGNSFKNFDDCVSYLRKQGVTYYTLTEIDGEDVFIFYVPKMSKKKFIIQEVKFSVTA